MIGWTEPLSADDTSRLLDKAANAVVKRGMEVPAILFLEMHKPFSYISSQALIVTHPLIAPLAGLENVQTLSRLLMDRNNIEMLIRRIEELAAGQQSGAKKSKEG